MMIATFYRAEQALVSSPMEPSRALISCKPQILSRSLASMLEAATRVPAIFVNEYLEFLGIGDLTLINIPAGDEGVSDHI
jgi:hypothetical protein